MTETKKTSRRNFLKTSSTAVAGASVLGSLSLNANVHAAGDDVIKVGLIGCGDRGSGAAAQSLEVAQNVKLVAMYDVFEDRLLSSMAAVETARPGQVEVDA